MNAMRDMAIFFKTPIGRSHPHQEYLPTNSQEMNDFLLHLSVLRDAQRELGREDQVKDMDWIPDVPYKDDEKWREWYTKQKDLYKQRDYSINVEVEPQNPDMIVDRH